MMNTSLKNRIIDVLDVLTKPGETTVGYMAQKIAEAVHEDQQERGVLEMTVEKDFVAEFESNKADKDQAYLERNHLVAALSRLYPSGIRKTNINGWSEDWLGCVYIDLPSGQISYHYHDRQAYLFERLPAYQWAYDLHDKDDVHERLSKVSLASYTSAHVSVTNMESGEELEAISPSNLPDDVKQVWVQGTRQLIVSDMTGHAYKGE